MNNTKQNIDIVITWVDGNDVKLNEKRQQYIVDELAVDAVSSTRFASNDEIYFCIASILKYFPDFGTIYLVTDGQKPTYLEQFFEQNLCSRGQLKVIDHTELFKGYTEYLPTFNSLSIEAMLWNIPNLAEQFIYLNDDVFLTSKVSRNDAFTSDKVMIYGSWKKTFFTKLKYKYRKFISEKTNKKMKPKFTTAQMLSADMLGLYQYYNLHHRPHFILTNVLKNYFLNHPDILKQQIQHKFRHFDQFLPVGLANHLSIQQNKAILREDVEVAYCKPDQNDISIFIQDLNNDKVQYGCIQSLDLIDQKQQRIIYAALLAKYHDFLPQYLKDQVI